MWKSLQKHLRHDSATLRGFAAWGATRLPHWWLRSSPGPIALMVGLTRAPTRAQLLENHRFVQGHRATLIEALDVAATLANYGHCLAEGLAGSGPNPPPFRYTIEGRENLEKARERNRGAILVTIHAGSWDVAGAVMKNRGFELGIAMAKERDARAREISDAARHRAGVKVFHVGDDPLSVLPLAQHVRHGGAVALQVDRVPTGMRSRPVPFFGRRYRVPLGPFQLAQVTGAPIIPVFTARLGFADHLVRADTEVTLPRRATPAELDRAMSGVMAAAERFVRRFPNQWFNFAPLPIDESTATLGGEEPSVAKVG